MSRGAAAILATFLFWAALFAAIWPLMLALEPDGLYAGWVNIWGDWASHLSFSTYLAEHDEFPPQFPIMAGRVFSYAFAADFLPALLLRAGVPLVPAMVGPKLVLSVALVATLLWFYRQLLQSHAAAAIAVFLFFLNGGLGFLWLVSDVSQQGMGSVARLPREYTHLRDEANIEWVNIITSEIIPQRGFLLALPFSVAMLGLFWRWYASGVRPRPWHLLLAGTVTGALPLVHMHSLPVLLGMASWTCLLTIPRQRWRVARWLWYFLPAILLAALLISTFYPHLGAQSLRLRLGWLADQSGDNVLWFWLKNAGVALPLSLAGFFLVPRKLLLWSLPFWGLFVGANLFIFQPWDWDNTKFFTYWWLTAAGFAALAIDRLLARTPTMSHSLEAARRAAAVLLFLLVIASGALDVFRLTQHDQLRLRMVSGDGLELARWARENTPRDAVFLTADNHDHPVAMLSGRAIVLGYRGWLWSWGIDVSERLTKVEAVYAGRDGAEEFLRDLGVSHVVIGPAERQRYSPLNEAFFRDRFPLLFENGQGRIFAVD